jgi:GNAT superfamily N-acetyltransferase
MKSSYRIYQVDVTHLDAKEELAEMHKVCFPEFEQIEPWGDWWFAYKTGSNKPVAFAGLWPSQRVQGAGYLARAGVMPEARGHGLQRRLIRSRELAARKKGWTVLFSDTWVGNVNSLNNLFAMGFRAFQPSDPWNGPEFIYLKKIIAPGVA